MHLDWMAVAVAGGAVVTVAALSGVYVSVVGTARGAARRLQRRLSPSPDLPDIAVPRKDDMARLVAKGLQPLAALAASGEGQTFALRTRLVQGGVRSNWSTQAFLAAKAALALVLVVLALAWGASRARPLPGSWMASIVLAAATVGFFLPNLWLVQRVKARKRSIERAIPDALDLLVTCVEAGLGLDAAVQRVSAEVALAHPLLSEELTLTFLEAKAGVRRTEAFRRLAHRTGVQDLRTLAATLNQTEMFGTSVATALRVQADGMRVRRMQKAEERAAMLSAKMTVPLVVCFLPTLLVVIIGPAFVNLAEVFAKGVVR
jgi:tight adherence protein C